MWAGHRHSWPYAGLLQWSPQEQVGRTRHDPVMHCGQRPRAWLPWDLRVSCLLGTVEIKLKGTWRGNNTGRYDSTCFTFSEVKWFPPLSKLQCFLPLILKAFSDPFPPKSWLYIQHPTNDFLLKNEKNTDTRMYKCWKQEWKDLFILLQNIALSSFNENIQILHKD